MFLRTKGGSGPSGMDADGWKKIIFSKKFKQSADDFCRALANVAIKLSTKDDLTETLEAFLACRLIPLDKNPGLRPIGIGEVVRRVVGKAIMNTFRDNVIESVGSLQTCAGHEAGCEASVHAMREIFNEADTEAVLLVDASNAFNVINRQAFLHNIRIICPEIAIYVHNCYSKPSRLFVLGGTEISSSEGTTQGDPIAMAIYATATIPIILLVLEVTDKLPNKTTKSVAYADDLAAGGILKNLKIWWHQLLHFGPKFGYYPQPPKCWLIVKPEHIDTAKELFADTNISITIDGRKHLGAAIGTDEYRDKYVVERLEKLKGELRLLSRIANIDPQAAYCCFVKGFKNKFSYMMRTIPKISNLLKSIDDVVTTQFIPAITGGIYVNQEQRRLLSLPVKLGGLAIPIFSDISDNEFSFSVKISENHVNGILAQQRKYTKDSEMAAKKNDIKKMKKELNERILSEISKTLSTEDSRLLQLSMENGASTWLSTLPLAEEGYHLTKQNFWDFVMVGSYQDYLEHVNVAHHFLLIMRYRARRVGSYHFAIMRSEMSRQIY